MARSRAKNGPDDETLWNLFREGDENAFAQLYQNYVQTLYHYCAHFAADRALIKDCIHDLFVELWKHRSTIGPTTSVRFYLMASIKRKLVRHLTAEQKLISQDDTLNGRRLGDTLIDADPSHENRLISFEEDLFVNDCLQQALEKLPRRQREAVHLRFFQNMSNEEISALMDINIQSVYNLIFGAMSNLKRYITLEKIYL
ncbi:RNA polymerase sigma factor [Spirosoma pomorum]